MEKPYKVTITEMRAKSYIAHATTAEEAKEIIKAAYDNSTIILDESDFIDNDFESEELNDDQAKGLSDLPTIAPLCKDLTAKKLIEKLLKATSESKVCLEVANNPEAKDVFTVTHPEKGACIYITDDLSRIVDELTGNGYTVARID